MSNKIRSIKRAAKKAAPAAALDTEILDITHAAVTEEMVKALLPDGLVVPIADLQQLSYLVTHPLELDEVAPSRTKALANSFNVRLNEQFRAAQEARLKATGRARP